MEHLPIDLLTAIENNNCIFFIGAGMSVTSGLPLGKSLAEKISREFQQRGFDIPLYDNLTELAKYCETQGNALKTLKEKIADALLLIPREIPVEYRLLAFLCKKKNIEIYTTNYDLLIEHVFNLYGVKFKTYGADDTISSEMATKLIKLTGDVHNLDKMKVTSADLYDIHNTVAFKYLVSKIESQTKVVFIGYGFSDMEIAAELKIHQHKDAYYMIGQKKPNAMEVEPVCNTAQAFFSSLINKLQLDIEIAHIKFDSRNFGGIETYLSHITKIDSEIKVGSHKFNSHYFNIYDKQDKLNHDSIELGFPFVKGAASITAHEVISQKKFDVIHAHDFISAYHAQMLGVPVVFTSHSLSSKDNKSIQGLFNSHSEVKNMEQAYYPLIQNIITLSDYHKKELPPFSNLHAKKLPVPFYIDAFVKTNEWYSTQERARESLDKHHNIQFKKNDFVIMYIGRNDSRKGFQFLLSCFEKLKDEYSEVNLELLLVTPGIGLDNRSNIVVKQTQTASGGCVPSQRIYHFATKHPSHIHSLHFDWREGDFESASNIIRAFDLHFQQIARAYRAADLVVIPSLYEPMGYVALEALACGCPIIANETGGLKEILQNGQKQYATFCKLGENPYSVSAPDILFKAIKEVTNCIGGKYTIKEDIKLLALEGQSYVKQKYCLDNNIKAVEGIRNLYMNAIINSADIPMAISEKEVDATVLNTCREVYDAAFEFYMKGVDDCTEIIKRAGYFYRDVLFLHAKLQGEIGELKKPQKYTEDYGLFWGIAGMILKKKADYPAITLMGVRSLAEAITEITRSRANSIKSIFEETMGWEQFVTKNYSSLKKVYQSSEEFSVLEKKWEKTEPVATNDLTLVVSSGISEEQQFIIQTLINNMIEVKEQTFVMGAAENHKNCLDIEFPQNKVKLSTYHIGKFPVTQKEWKAIMGSNPSWHQGDNYPVENISYHDCELFVKKLNTLIAIKNWEFDIPTEAQWECAAKCGMDDYTDFAGDDNLLETGWFSGNTETTHVVGQLKSNAWGLSDMCGNVMEFCKDVYSDDFYKTLGKLSENPCCTKGDKDDHTLRGGAFNKMAQCCRVTNRYDRYNTYDSSGNIGLRLVLNAKMEE